jgi:GxxExxY protein
MIDIDILYKDETYAIIGAAIEVHSVLGNGFLEGVYDEALRIELKSRGIPFKSQVPLPIYYKNQLIQKCFVADMICYEKIIIELKAISKLSNIESAQIINYLKATNIKLGLLINFGSSIKMEWKRFIYTDRN